MLNNTPSLDLVEFIETQILPQYAQFDKAHSMEHVIRVVRSSLELARTTGADINMVYTTAAYHDIGCSLKALVLSRSDKNHKRSN